MTRTDVHAPAHLVIEDYDYLGSFDLNSEYPHARMELMRELIAAGHTFASIHPRGQCDHCGTRIRYAAYMLHRPTGKVLTIGQTCLDNRFERATADFRKLQKQAQIDREAQRIKAAREEYAAANPDVYGYLTEQEHRSDFLNDMRRKLRQYGYLTDRQTDAVRRGIERDRQRQQEREEREANAESVPEGRQRITGRIISTKTSDGPYGAIPKMLVEDDRGFRVFGTTPNEVFRAVNNTMTPIIGLRVTFTATVEPSKDDRTFGFYKRPTRVEVLNG